MPTCPVCEHRQETGESCDVCGRAFVEARTPDVTVEAVPGLERDRWEEPFPEDAALMPELEGTAAAPVQVDAQPMPDIEATATAPVQESLQPPMVDLDRGREADDGARVALQTGPATCRYCKHVQAEGLLCDKCGMRLPRAAPPPKAVKAKGALEPVRCQRCGEKVMPQARCSGCGQLAQAPE